MTTSILICDDSSLAQKQMARALPEDWLVELFFAKDGVEGVRAIKSGKANILFLDLNMPKMDGYQVLQHIQKESLKSTVIVVSGDIQPEAHKRVMQLGAVDFIKKPVDATVLAELINKHKLRELDIQDDASDDNDEFDGFREIANVSMGRAADLLARLLDCFVIMPIPSVNTIEVSELRMALNAVDENENVSAVCQGFIGSGVAGEALIIFNESSFTDIAELMKYEGEIDDSVQLELLMDIASILIGAFLKGISEQLDLQFSQSHPIILGQHVKIGDLVKRSSSKWNKTLAIEMGYKIEGKKINCDLLLLFTEESIPKLNMIIEYLQD